MIPESALLQRNPNLIGTELDGDLVMMDVEQGTYFALQGIGGHLWDLLEHPIAFGDLVSHVHETFEIGEDDRVSDDLQGFLADMLKRGLVFRADA